MFDVLLSEAVRLNDLRMIKQFPPIFLNEMEKAAVKWIEEYKRQYSSFPTIERFKDTEHGILYTERYNGSPIGDLYQMALDRKRQQFFFAKVHAIEEATDAGKTIPPSEIVQLGHDLAVDGRIDHLEYKSIDRSELYTGMSEEGIKFGLTSLDNETGGLIEGETCVLVARPGQGKTWVSCFMANKWYKEGKRVLFLSYEMPDNMIIARLDSILLGINSKEIRKSTAATRRSIISRIEEKIRDTDKAGGQILFPKVRGAGAKNSMKASTVDNLYEQIEELEPHVVIADGIYLARLAGMSPGMPEWQRVKMVSNMYKQVAMDTGVIVFSTSQLKRTGKVDGFDLDDIAYSDAISQDADMVIAGSKDNDMSNIFYLTLMKNRNGGGIASETVKFDFAHSTMVQESFS